MCRCLDTVGRAVSKLDAIAPAVIDCEATNRSMLLLVGSAIAWNTSRRRFIMKLFGYKYKRSHLTTQFFLFYLSPRRRAGSMPLRFFQCMTQSLKQNFSVADGFPDIRKRSGCSPEEPESAFVYAAGREPPDTLG